MNAQERAGIGRCQAWLPGARGACVLFLGLVLVAAPMASAHANEVSGHSHHGSPARAVGALLLAMAGLGLAAAVGRGRPAAVLSFALLVGVFGVESAIHSVHHFSDPQAAASCPLFSASQHAQAAGTPTVDTGAPTWTVEPSPGISLDRIMLLRAFSPHEGRAPPVLPSA